MTRVHGPTVGRRRLRSALRRARETAGLTQEQVAVAMDWSLSKVIRIEAGTVSISTNDLKALLAYYRLTDSGQVADLVELARAARRRSWWSAYKDVVPPGFLSFIGLEAEASSLQVFQAVGIPGLLQTEAYARAMVAAALGSDHTDPTRLETLVELRLRRQREVLERPDPPEIQAVLDEATLHRQVGGALCLKEQLLHLVTLCSDANVAVQVLPFTATDYSVAAPFIVLRFPHSNDTGAVYLEAAIAEDVTVIDRPEAVQTYQETFQRLREKSLSPSESLARIEKIAGELG